MTLTLSIIFYVILAFVMFIIGTLCYVAHYLPYDSIQCTALMVGQAECSRVSHRLANINIYGETYGVHQAYFAVSLISKFIKNYETRIPYDDIVLYNREYKCSFKKRLWCYFSKIQ